MTCPCADCIHEPICAYRDESVEMCGRYLSRIIREAEQRVVETTEAVRDAVIIGEASPCAKPALVYMVNADRFDAMVAALAALKEARG